MCESTAGKLSEELAKTQKQLDDCRVENVTLFEKARGGQKGMAGEGGERVGGGGGGLQH